jgi:trimethylamine--corrinoid protein Co-methyltransferase
MIADDNPRRPPIEPLKRAFTLRFHTPAQLDRIKQATLDILETVGVKFPSAKALAILVEHGCPVDRERQVVTFPPDIVLAAMAKAPRYFDLGARDPSCAFSLADDTTY